MSSEPSASVLPTDSDKTCTDNKPLEEKRLDFSDIEIPPKETLINEKGRNKTNVFCVRCPSKILNPRVSKFKSIEVSFLLLFLFFIV